MLIFAAQEPKSEQQDDENPVNPFSVVQENKPEKDNSAAAESDSSSDRSNLIFDRDVDANRTAKPAGITDDMVLPGNLPSNGNSGARQPGEDESIGFDDGNEEQLTESIGTSNEKSNQTDFSLADVHWSIWLVAIVVGLGLAYVIGMNFLKRQSRSKRPRTKANTFKPVTNRLKHNSVKPVQLPGANGVASSSPTNRLSSVSNGKDTHPNSDFGTTVRETAVVGSLSMDEGGEEAHHPMTLEAMSVAVLDEQAAADEAFGMFDGESKEAEVNGHSNGNGNGSGSKGSLIAELTAEISSLKETLGSVKLDRNIRSQLESAKTELEWKNSLLEKSERLADDRETALGIAVQAQTELREKVNALSAELDRVKEHVVEMEDRERKLQEELAAERTAMVALHRMVEDGKDGAVLSADKNSTSN